MKFPNVDSENKGKPQRHFALRPTIAVLCLMETLMLPNFFTTALIAGLFYIVFTRENKHI